MKAFYAAFPSLRFLNFSSYNFAFHGTDRKLLSGFSLFALLLFAGSASANPVTTVSAGGKYYSVTYQNFSYSGSTPTFSATQMPWWGDQTLARQFATAVDTKLGLPNTGGYGPFFAYASSNYVNIQVLYAANVNDNLALTTYSSIYAILLPFSPSTLQPYASNQSIGLDALKNKEN
jgi:hypothetical protein